MGGRGSISSGSRGKGKTTIIDGKGKRGTWDGKLPEEKETRSDIRKLFIEELGFKELYGTNEIPTAQLAAFAIELKKHEPKIGLLEKQDVVFAAVNVQGVYGFATMQNDGTYVLAINPKSHKSVSSRVRSAKSDQSDGFKVKNDGKITSNFTTTARHEYGHLVQFAITEKTGKSASQIRSEVQDIAKKKYGAKTSAPSGYGKTNEYEYFAESFTGFSGGSKEPHSKALGDWLKKNKP